MTRLRFPVIICLAYTIFFSGCSAPPEKAASVTLMQSLNDFFNSEESPVSVLDLFFSFRKLQKTDDLITVLTEGDRFILIGEESIPADETLLYTTGGNHIKVHRTVFMTSDRKRRLFYSLDSQVWYPMKNYRKKGEINVEYSFNAETVYDEPEHDLYVHFQWMAGKSRTAVPVKMKKKPLISLENSMVFYSTDKEADTVDLSGNFIKIPGGTDLSFQILFTGNLLKSGRDSSTDEVVILRDFQIYTTNDSDYKLGISLDGKKWNYNIFAFKYNVTESFHGQSSSGLKYERLMEISYNK